MAQVLLVLMDQEKMIQDLFNGNSRIPKWRYVVPFKAIFCGDIPLHRPYIGLIYGRYLQFRFLKWPLIVWIGVQYSNVEYWNDYQ